MLLEARADRAEALAYAGYFGKEPDDFLEERMTCAMTACEAELAARGAYRVFPVARNDGRVVALAGTALELPGASISAHVGDAGHVALLAVTLGMESERALRRHAALGTVDGLLFSAAASSLVESGADALEAIVRTDAAAHGWECTGRFSPGYGDLPLGVQRPFVEALGGAQALGITVGKGGFMVPTKSITAVMALRDRSAVHGGEGPECGESGSGGDAGEGMAACGECARRENCEFVRLGRTCRGAQRAGTR